MSIPTVEVQGTYLIDPQTEDLIWGDELRDGMVVLAEDDLIMRHPTRSLESMRWCRVSNLRSESSQVRFIGVYGDGSKFVREGAKSWAWFVKRDSIPSDEEPTA